MNQVKLQKFIIVCIGVLPLLSPTALSIEFISISPEIMKTFFGIIFINISIIWWLFGQIKSKKIIFFKDRSYIPIFSFLGWCYLSLFWIYDSYMAILLLAQFTSFVLIFVLIVNIFKEYKLLKSLLKAIILSMTLVSIIGLLQYYFPNIEIIQNFFVQTAKPGATFANKNMASHFIVMTLPLALVFMIASKNKFSAAVYSLSLFIGSWFLIYTFARQAYVAIFIELVILGLFLLLDFYKNRGKTFLKEVVNRRFKLASLLFILASLLLVSNLTDSGWSFNKGKKIDQLQSINMQGGNSRFPAWVNTLEIIKDNPVIGVGIGQWQFAYPRYYDVNEKDIIFNEKVKLKRLHNDYLETFANVGLVGYLFLIWMLFLITKYLWLILSNPENRYRYQALGIGMGLIGFSVVAFFSFPVRVYLPAFLVLVYVAIIVLLKNDDEMFKEKAASLQSQKYLKSIMILIVVLGLFVTYYSYRWVLSEHHKSISMFKISSDLVDKSTMNTFKLSHSLKAIEYNKLQKDNYMIIGETLLSMGQNKKAEPYFKKVVDLSPYNSIALLKLAEIYENQGTLEQDLQKRKGFSAKQIKVLEFILSFDPKNVNALSFLAKNLAINERGKDATIVYARLKKSFEYFKDRSNFGPYHNNVGFIAISVGDYEYAEYIYKDAIEKFPTAENYYKMAILKYDYLKNYKEGADFAKKALEIDPNFTNNEEIRKLIKKHESSSK
ncbi:MAG: hypothetical protein HOE35_01455 [Candidatus Ruthia sp.]|jgi:O-antigen ligase|nr:hypothetical protein [Candidatus Ruthturnera sp.]